jgi:2-dehydro-3-deoxyglucarate aldolase
MGVTGQFDHPDMVNAKRRILDACREHGVAAGIHVVPPDVDEVVQCFQEGYRLIAYSLDITMLAHACRSGLSEIRQRLSMSER